MAVLDPTQPHGSSCHSFIARAAARMADIWEQGPRGLQILALHGGNDRNVPPAVAQRFIEKAFGSDVLAPVDKHWYVLKDEDHVLHLNNSWAVEHAKNELALRFFYPILFDCSKRGWR